jgi:phage shock protein PspC (stress-responsive transcriptional regulator)
MKLPNGVDPEVVLLIFGMVIIFGATLALNFIVYLFIPGLGQ